MSDFTQPRSVSECDNDLLDSATGYQAYPSLLVSSRQTDSYPSIPGLRPTEEPTYIRTGARAQSQNLLSEIRAANVFDRFQSLRMEIDYWEYELKTQCFSFDEINEQFNSLIKNVNILEKEAILANVDLTVCGHISECRTAVQRLKTNALYDLDSLEYTGLIARVLETRMDSGMRLIYLSGVRSLIMLVNDLSCLF